MNDFNEKSLWPAFQRVNNLLKDKADENSVEAALATKADQASLDLKYDKAGGTITGNVEIERTQPKLILTGPEKTGEGKARAMLQKITTSVLDGGTRLTDFAYGAGPNSSSNDFASIVLMRRAETLADMLKFGVYESAEEETVWYHLYGEHNPPGVADVPGLQVALDGKAASVHSHAVADVSGLQTALDSKAAAVHSHSLPDVTALLQATSYGPADLVPLDGECGGLPLNQCSAAVLPVQAGSGDPSPSNIRAISGRTEARITRARKNLLKNGLTTRSDEKITVNADGTITFKNIGSNIGNVCTGHIGFSAGQLDYRKWLPNGTYRAFSGTSDSNAVLQVGYYSDNGTLTLLDITSTFTITKEMKYVVIRMRIYNQTGQFTCAPMICRSDETDTTFEPYAGDIKVFDWSASAGTVYGGTLDAVGGTLTVTYGQISSYAGESLPGAWISDRDVYAEGTSPSAGAQVVYELADPVVYQLTPQPISSFQGDHSIWCDTGPVTIEYGAFLLALQREIEALATQITS